MGRWLVMAGVLAFSGCADPEESFDAYTKRVRDLQGAEPDGGGGGQSGCGQPDPAQIAPEYVFTMSMRLTPGQAFLSRGTATAERVGEELHVRLQMQWLAAGDRATGVGEPFEYGPIVIDREGNTRSEPKRYTLPGASNPALCGIELSATTSVRGQWCRPEAGEEYAEVSCGAVTGTLHPPPLEQDLEDAGGIFRLQVLEANGSLPASLIGCPGDALVAPQCQ
jgi:hypothetical protein